VNKTIAVTIIALLISAACPAEDLEHSGGISFWYGDDYVPDSGDVVPIKLYDGRILTTRLYEDVGTWSFDLSATSGADCVSCGPIASGVTVAKHWELTDETSFSGQLKYLDINVSPQYEIRDDQRQGKLLRPSVALEHRFKNSPQDVFLQARVGFSALIDDTKDTGPFGHVGGGMTLHFSNLSIVLDAYGGYDGTLNSGPFAKFGIHPTIELTDTMSLIILGKDYFITKDGPIVDDTFVGFDYHW
jgi:hypothetical protein